MGPAERFEALFGDHAGAVRAYAARRGALDEADDVVAEVFLVAWRRLDELPAEPLPWLLGVARRVLANRRRTQTRQQAVRTRLGRERPPSATELDALADRNLATALARLREPDREVLLLSAWEGLAPEQAARVLGVSRGAFAVRLHRARRRFARLLEESEAPSLGEPSAMEVT